MLYPISTKSRQLMDLSGIWEFKLNHDQETDENGTKKNEGQHSNASSSCL